ncbi:hypothetical protein AFLA_008777 [Aspergillus flavus NRRL3357]|nr:hypothetical protein AFLA_008777 [Aspergillus flavus NRRL3357]
MGWLYTPATPSIVTLLESSTAAATIEKEGGGRNPYRRLEERYNFWDVRAKRKEFADWVKGENPLNE